MPCPCRDHAVPLPCRAAKRLECVFPIWFTQCGCVWFTLAMPRPCHALHALAMSFISRPQHSTAVKRRPCCGLEKNGMVEAWHGCGMASVNQTRPHCVNQMGKTHSKRLAARHGRGTAWSRHGHGMLCVWIGLYAAKYFDSVLCSESFVVPLHCQTRSFSLYPIMWSRREFNRVIIYDILILYVNCLQG